MTPEEVFAQLRDLHSPDIATTVGYGLDPRPLIVFACLVLSVLAARVLLRWRRFAVRLSAVDQSLPPAVQRDRIALILKDNPKRRSRTQIPPAFFAPPSRVTDRDAEELRRWARQRLR